MNFRITSLQIHIVFYYNECKTSKNYISAHFISIFVILGLFCLSVLLVYIERFYSWYAHWLKEFPRVLKLYSKIHIALFLSRIFKLQTLVSPHFSYQFSWFFFLLFVWTTRICEIIPRPRRVSIASIIGKSFAKRYLNFKSLYLTIYCRNLLWWSK